MGFGFWEVLDGSSATAEQLIPAGALEPLYDPGLHHVYHHLGHDAHDFLGWKPMSFLDAPPPRSHSTSRSGCSRSLVHDVFSNPKGANHMADGDIFRHRRDLHSAFLSPSISPGAAKPSGVLLRGAPVKTVFDKAEGEALSAVDAAESAEKSAEQAKEEAEEAEEFEERVVYMCALTLVFALAMGFSSYRMYHKWLEMKKRYRDYVLARRAEGQLQ
eukprot:gnl/MRDRNA2_/MRDRNA2_125109_c0_seq1.p1 gnl/MRDRNA2_/MRDRNA2_125109_c0~~gnl/MRDRNA2_/MRDRNA2_125109_c0_seq1.p1  ORF type:complete len:216 (+),score=37.27 gnl/MRDRNA2_/MRDRNA2_125109_c0_seq1:56-703(+)